jgi:hypothetical protein
VSLVDSSSLTDAGTAVRRRSSSRRDTNSSRAIAANPEPASTAGTSLRGTRAAANKKAIRKTSRSVTTPPNSDLGFPDSDNKLDHSQQKAKRSKRHATSDNESEFNSDDGDDDSSSVEMEKESDAEVSEVSNDSSTKINTRKRFGRMSHVARSNDTAKASAASGKRKSNGHRVVSEASRTSPARTTRVRTSYYDPSSSDFDSDDDNGISEPPKQTKKAKVTKRTGMYRIFYGNMEFLLLYCRSHHFLSAMQQKHRLAHRRRR